MTKLQDFLNSPIAHLIPRGGKQGDLFGVELECEGKQVDFDGEDRELLKSWAPHDDGSLRKHHGSSCEWVFNGPVGYDQSIIRVNQLFDYFDKRKAKLVLSNRTSTHVHFNMGDKNAYQVVNLFILFAILEDIFGRYCGEDRNGNLFCLSSRHAYDQVRWVEDICFKHLGFGNLREDMRYCALNIASINKFGTVEFRGMRGLDNRQDMLDWLSIINEFVDYACYKMHNPVDIIESISVKTPLGFLKEIFSKDNFMKLTKGIDEQDINNSIYEGLRLVQMLCYRIGTEFDKVRLKGKDFWASFGGGPDPVLDVDPEVFINQGMPKARRPRGLPPQMIDPFARPAPQGINPLRDMIWHAAPDQQVFVVEDAPRIAAKKQANRDEAELAERWAQVAGRAKPVKILKEGQEIGDEF